MSFTGRGQPSAPPAGGIDADVAVSRIPTFQQTLRVWLRIGLLSFGGPAGQIALLHREVVDERRWIGEQRFLHALNFCTLLPGPEAQQLATYLGWLMHGVRGGLAAGLLFILPGAAVMLGLSIVYVLFGAIPVISALFFGLKCAVLVLVVEALIRVGRRALAGRASWLLAGIAFAALFFLNAPFPVVVLVAAVVGFVIPVAFRPARHGEAKTAEPALIDAMLEADPERPRRLAVTARRAGIIALALWLIPVALLMAALPGTYADIGWFFSKMAVVTVGGAYAVLAYVAQDAVEAYGWLSASEMLSGLGLAETTPGPLILVLQFVGFLAGYRANVGPNGIAGAVLGSALTLWVTFAPCFAFVFLGAPLVERLQAIRPLSGALSAITAAVVGVIANLALWFCLRVLFRSLHEVQIGWLRFDVPNPTTVDLNALVLSLLAAACLFWLRLGVLPTLGIAAAAGVAIRLLGLIG